MRRLALGERGDEHLLRVGVVPLRPRRADCDDEWPSDSLCARPLTMTPHRTPALVHGACWRRQGQRIDPLSVRAIACHTDLVGE